MFKEQSRASGLEAEERKLRGRGDDVFGEGMILGFSQRFFFFFVQKQQPKKNGAVSQLAQQGRPVSSES